MSWRSFRRAGTAPETARYDVAVYSPASSIYFEAGGVTGEAHPHQGGGAELQMALLALGLAAKGFRVALITYPIHRLRSIRQPLPDLIKRASYGGDRPLIGKLAEMVNVWRALSRVDAGAYIFRSGGPRLLAAALFTRLHRRKLVFSAANDLDFEFDRADQPLWSRLLARIWLRGVDLVVTQRREQLELAKRIGVAPLALVPSFAETVEATPDGGDAMLWVGRIVDYKRPVAFLELAEALPELNFRMAYIAIDSELTQRVEGIGARIDNLELLGGLPRPRLLEELDRTKALVSTSAKEGMPNVFLEAWARGIPVISLDYDPDGRIAADEMGLVAGGSMDRLREETETLWRDSGLRDELGGNGRAYVRRVHSPEAVAEQWAELIRGLGAGT